MSEPTQYKIETKDGQRYHVYRRVRGFLGFMKWEHLSWDVCEASAVGTLSRYVAADRAAKGFPKFYSSEDFAND